MKKKVKIISIIGIVVIILIILFNMFFKEESVASVVKEYVTKEYTVESNTITKNLTSAVQVEGSLSEQILTRTGYYYKESYVSENTYISKGENVLKYSNGTYMTAPYNAIVSSISLPEEGGICTDKHYIEFTSIDTLKFSVDIDESEIRYIEIGKEVEIKLNAFEDKTYTGYISHVDSKGTYQNSSSTFGIEITLVNSGNIKIGMSGYTTIIMQEKEDIITIPIEAVKYDGDKKYVSKISQDGTIQKQEIETGLADSEKVEVLSGLSNSNKIQYEVLK